MTIILKGNFVTRTVWLNGETLDPENSQVVWNHSPDGFAWGYAGSGPSQLALAILLKIMSKEKALKFYQSFKFKEITTLPQASFEKEIQIDLS
jgi:hypothetical protein